VREKIDADAIYAEFIRRRELKSPTGRIVLLLQPFFTAEARQWVSSDLQSVDDLVNDLNVWFMAKEWKNVRTRAFTNGNEFLGYLSLRCLWPLRVGMRVCMSEVFPLGVDGNPTVTAHTINPTLDEYDEWLRARVRARVRILGPLRRFVLDVVAQGDSAVAAVPSAQRRFVRDYAAVSARIAGREYHADPQ
jgi:hypothetical protein